LTHRACYLRHVRKYITTQSAYYSLPDPFCASNLARAALRAFSLLSVNKSAPSAFPFDDFFHDPIKGIPELPDCSVEPNTCPEPVNAAVELPPPSFFDLPVPPSI
jgi:hypothetical protein